MTATVHQLRAAAALPPKPITVSPASPDDLAAQATQIILDMITFAERHALPSPTDEALLIDGEVIATWPPGLWRKAFRSLWETWTYRRMPTAGDFRALIAADLAALQPAPSPFPVPTLLGPAIGGPSASTAPTRPSAPSEHPKTLDDCIAALRAAGVGTITTWKNRARSRNPDLTPQDLADMTVWVPVIADLLADIGLHGSP